MDSKQMLREMVIRKLGQLCMAHEELTLEKNLVEAKILETVEVLKECYLPGNVQPKSKRVTSSLDTVGSEQ